MRLAATILLVFSAALSAQVESFTIHEEFGVAHPRQIIDFDLHSKPDPANTYLTGPEGGEVPFQVLSGRRIAVETDLPAGGEKTWRLYQGHAPAAAAPGVELKTAPGWYELTNGITGVRIPRPSTATDLSPIQGVRYRDGVWTGVGPNYLLDAGEHRLTAKTLAVRFVERGPLKVVAELSYSFARPDFLYGNKVLIPGGTGFYKCTIEIQAGQPSILMEEDTDMDLRYQFLISQGLDPDQARYRGHFSNSIANGHKADGTAYDMYHEPPQDLIRDLRFDPPEPSCYSSNGCIRQMAVWDPWVYDSGWYWQIYRASAGAKANLFGIFAGRASEALGAGQNGVGVYTTSKRATGIRFTANRRAPDGKIYPRIRISWGVFTGVKGLDMGNPLETQAIQRQMNLHAGINLNKIYRYPADAELKAPAKPLYMSGGAVEKMAARVRKDPVYSRRLAMADATVTPMLDFWREGSFKKGAVATEIGKLSHDFLDAMVNGNGIYDFFFHYWMGGLQMSREAIWINAILGSADASAADRRIAGAAAVLFGGVLWDDDFVPMFGQERTLGDPGLNLGTANMPVQQRGYRDLYALMLGDQPWMGDHVHSVVASAVKDLRDTVNEAGAHMGSTHYIDAAMGPLLSTLQQIQTSGTGDPFRSEPRLARFAEFYMNLLTPPEQRFGGTRKLVAIGDANTESSELYGQLGTGFSAVDPDLSARLMWAWNKDGAAHSSFHGTTVLKIDDSLPMKDPALGDASFPGWYSVLRNGWGTRDETAMWFVNGSFYRDHWHEDSGNVAIYALGAPLSLDWGTMYLPNSPGAMVHNAPVPEAKLKTRWDGDATLDNIGFRWEGAVEEAFESFMHSSYTRAAFQHEQTKWQRSVVSIHPDESHPVLIIRDRFAGAGAAQPKILSLNVVATGPVDTPAGPMLPVDRMNKEPEKTVPSALPAQALGKGLSRFGFTGVPQAGRIPIDADIYVGGASQTTIGHWGHRSTPSMEHDEFAKANDGKQFEESQHILRLRGTGEFLLILLPHRRGEAGAASVEETGNSVTVKTGDETTTFDDASWSFESPRGTGAGSFGTGKAGIGQLEISGGPGEIFAAAARVTVTLHGPAGRRTVRWPGGVRTLEYAGGKPMTVTLGPGN